MFVILTLNKDFIKVVVKTLRLERWDSLLLREGSLCLKFIIRKSDLKHFQISVKSLIFELRSIQIYG